MTTADHDLPFLAPLDCAAPLPLPLASGGTGVSPVLPPNTGETPVPPGISPTDRTLQVLGVRITDATRQRAIELLRDMLPRRSQPTRCVYFVNAHTLNLAASAAAYRDVLNAGDFVFGDGTGVRWAARLQGVRLRDNLVGTDLTPQLLRAAVRLRPSLLPPRRRAVGHRARRRHGRRGLPRLDPGRLPSWILSRSHLDRRGHRPHQPRAAEPAPGRHGQSAPGAMDSRQSPAVGGPVVPGRWRAVSLLGRRSPPCADVAPPARGRMAGNSPPAAAQGPPLSARKPALPLAGDLFASQWLIRVFVSRQRATRNRKRCALLAVSRRPPCRTAAETRYYPHHERHLPGR